MGQLGPTLLVLLPTNTEVLGDVLMPVSLDCSRHQSGVQDPEGSKEAGQQVWGLGTADWLVQGTRWGGTSRL